MNPLPEDYEPITERLRVVPFEQWTKLTISVIRVYLTLMSKGLGQLQRDILAGLKVPIRERPGANEEGETQAYGRGFIPADNVYDLRHVLKVVSDIHRRRGGNWNKYAFQSAFSCAVFVGWSRHL